jgi:hypothetical protein
MSTTACDFCEGGREYFKNQNLQADESRSTQTRLLPSVDEESSSIIESHRRPQSRRIIMIESNRIHHHRRIES